ncbi:MAG: LacI family DNA-binding transcriptional regulator [Streptosporangiaceae bacterium]
MADIPETAAAPTIYDVARIAGVSIASVSRVLNDQRNPRQETRERVLQAVSELGFIPDGAARALSARLKEVVGVVMRRVRWVSDSEGGFAEEDENLQFTDVINRGIEVAAQRQGFNLLIGSVYVDDHDVSDRLLALARKSDGLILHDHVLEPDQLEQLSKRIPIVTLANVDTPTTVNVHGDNRAGMRDLARHLLRDHGYRTIAYLSGLADSPDSVARQESVAAEAAAVGATLLTGPGWQGNYYAAGGARVIKRLIASEAPLPRAIVCANDQTALGVMYALAQHGLDVPGDVAVAGYDDVPMARHLRPQLTTVRQPIQDIGATAFDLLHSMIGNGVPEERDIVLPTRLIRRESCGCPPEPPLSVVRAG